jgi:hypothetical protein
MCARFFCHRNDVHHFDSYLDYRQSGITAIVLVHIAAQNAQAAVEERSTLQNVSHVLVPTAAAPRGPEQLLSAAAQLGTHLLRYRTAVIGVSQRVMVERLRHRMEQLTGRRGTGSPGKRLGISRNTYRKMEAGNAAVHFIYWLAAWQELGLLNEVVRAGEPSREGFQKMLSTIPGYEGLAE